MTIKKENKWMYDEVRMADLADEISFKLLATKDHPDYDWLIEKLTNFIV